MGQNGKDADAYVKGPRVFYVDSDGSRIEGSVFSVGSGSTFAYGVLDNGYDPSMSVGEAVELGRRAIVHATHRDAMSGGLVSGTCLFFNA